MQGEPHVLKAPNINIKLWALYIELMQKSCKETQITGTMCWFNVFDNYYHNRQMQTKVPLIRYGRIFKY